MSSQFNVSYEWTGPGAAQQSGQELHISKEEKPDSVYTCTVKNEVSQKSSSFTVKDCDTGTLHAHYNNCWSTVFMMTLMIIVMFLLYLDEPPSEQNIILPVILAAIATVILGIVAPVAIYFILQKRKSKISWCLFQ